MSSLFKFENWEFLIEMARTARKCPIVDFRPLMQTPNYKDILYLGGREVSPQQGKKQGNLRFDYPDFKMTIRLNQNGAIWEDPRRDEGPNLGADALEFDTEAELYGQAPMANRDGKAVQIFPQGFESQKYFQTCLTIEDFDLRLEFIIKRILLRKGFFTKEEVNSDDSPNTLILKKISEDIEELAKLQTLNAVPPSLDLTDAIGKSITDGKMLDYEALFKTLEQEKPNLRKDLEAAGVDLLRAKKLSKGAKILKRKA